MSNKLSWLLYKSPLLYCGYEVVIRSDHMNVFKEENVDKFLKEGNLQKGNFASCVQFLLRLCKNFMTAISISVEYCIKNNPKIGGAVLFSVGESTPWLG